MTVKSMRTLDKEIRRKCPYCDKENNRVSNYTDDPTCPMVTPGDLSVCIGCGGIGVFGPKMKLRKITLKELAEIPDDDRAFLMKTQKHIREGNYEHE